MFLLTAASVLLLFLFKFFCWDTVLGFGVSFSVLVGLPATNDADADTLVLLGPVDELPATDDADVVVLPGAANANVTLLLATDDVDEVALFIDDLWSFCGE